MNIALILSGGIGSRMRSIGNCPKQYLRVYGEPIINYSLRTFSRIKSFQHFIIVANTEWYSFLAEQLAKIGILECTSFAPAGDTRTMSIYNGLTLIKSRFPQTEKVVIHDAARPFVSEELIEQILCKLDTAEAVMPVLPVKDTCYQSTDGNTITGFLPRNELFAGQAPEGFRFPTYFNLFKVHDKAYLDTISGSSELAFKNGIHVVMIKGAEKNFKITTAEDLKLMEKYLEREDLQS